MTRNDILDLNDEVVSSETYDLIAEHEDVISIENNGNSGRFVDKTWYSVFLTEDEEISIYL
ncbi:hypothetical protein D3C76_1835870 [compost metagenome]